MLYTYNVIYRNIHLSYNFILLCSRIKLLQIFTLNSLNRIQFYPHTYFITFESFE